MSQSNKVRSRRPWIIAAFFALLLLPLAFVFAMKPPAENPGVTVRFTSLTNSEFGPVALFTFTNASSLHVHVESYKIPGQQHYSLPSIPPGESAVVPVELPKAGPVTSTNEPVEVTFFLRRQDTAFEEAREMLDSVLGSIGVRFPGLNPDSSWNKFEITTAIPSPGP